MVKYRHWRVNKIRFLDLSKIHHPPSFTYHLRIIYHHLPMVFPHIHGKPMDVAMMTNSKTSHDLNHPIRYTNHPYPWLSHRASPGLLPTSTLRTSVRRFSSSASSRSCSSCRRSLPPEIKYISRWVSVLFYHVLSRLLVVVVLQFMCVYR